MPAEVPSLKASVVIPTYNKLPLLLATLDSLERQDCEPGDFEVVVVDDASRDGTAEALGNLARPYALRVVRHRENKGRAAARNSGVGAAQGRTVIFIDDDMEAAAGFVSSHMGCHKGGDKVAAVGNVRTHPRANHSAVSRYLDTRGAQKIRGEGELPFRYFSTNNSSVKKAHLQAVGLFDERFSSYGFEDVEIAARLSKDLGLRFVYLEEAASLHLHKHTLEDFLEKKVLCGRSSLRVLLLEHPELWSEVGLDAVERPRLLREPLVLSIKKIAFRILNAISFHGPAKTIVNETTFYHFTNVLLDYLVLRSYWIGLDRPEDRAVSAAAFTPEK